MPTRSSSWFITLLCLHLALAFSSNSSQPEVSVPRSSLKELLRSRRQICQEGTYRHDGRYCCKCGAGQRVKKHCTVGQDDGECEHCEPNTYNSEANGKETCQPCTSCSHVNANLEVDLPCTAARDAKCRCKTDHFCISDTGNCQICHPCNKCEHGIKEYCTPTNDTVCHKKDVSEADHTNTTVAVVVPIFVIACLAGAAVVGYLVWTRKKRAQRTITAQTNDGETTEEELQLLKGVDLQPHLSDIAEEIGWKDMKDVANRSRIKDTVIESCQLNHPGDVQEQTIQLLKEFVQRQSRDAPELLIRILQSSGKKDKAEKVKEILCRSKQDGLNLSA